MINALNEADRRAKSDKRGYIENGGWVVMDRRGKISAIIKPTEPEPIDSSTWVNIRQPPKSLTNASGNLVIVGTFHTHVNALSSPRDVDYADYDGVPGIWKSGDWVKLYGPDRGFWRRGSPSGCPHKDHY